jgi:hypothetical protein
MFNPITSIFRQVKRQPKDPLNILTFCTHERYETGLAMTGHNFYAYRAEGIKDWNLQYGKLPSNYILLDPELKENQIPNHVEFDLILSQNKFGQFQIAYPLSKQMQLPLVSLEHTLPMAQWTDEQRNQLKNARGDINVFISEYSLEEWWWDDRNDTVVIHHMVDTDIFKPPKKNVKRIPQILSVVNDWINRDYFCNFQGWTRITKDLPVRVIGDTPKLSKPAPSIEALVNEYQQSLIFLNTSTVSPIPTALLEAMACGCACVSTATCMIPEIIKHGYNGYIFNDESQLREVCQILLTHEDLCTKLGNNARQTILTNFSKESFVQKWNNVFRSVL